MEAVRHYKKSSIVSIDQLLVSVQIRHNLQYLRCVDERSPSLVLGFVLRRTNYAFGVTLCNQPARTAIIVVVTLVQSIVIRHQIITVAPTVP